MYGKLKTAQRNLQNLVVDASIFKLIFISISKQAALPPTQKNLKLVKRIHEINSIWYSAHNQLFLDDFRMTVHIY